MNSHPKLFRLPFIRNLKTPLPLLVAASVGLCLANQHSAAATLADWKFDAADPTADSSGNGHTLVMNGSISYSSDIPTNAPGVTNSAVFDGGSYFETASQLDLTPYNQLTIEFFAKFLTANGLQMFFSQNNPNNVQGGFYLDTGEAGAATAQFSISTGGGFSTRLCPEPTDVEWHHFALTIDESGPTPVVHIYVDGYRVDTGGVPAAIQSFLNDYFTIGAYPPTYAFMFVGSMGEMRISSGILPPAQFLIGAQPPVIFVDQPPLNRFTVTNTPVTFSVGASVQGGNPTPPVQYQWRENGGNIPDATNSSYTLANPTLADNQAQFDVVLSAAGATPVISAAATLTVRTSATIADWKFNAADPTADSSGNGNTLAFSGNIVVSSDVATNEPGGTNSVQFDGASFAQTVGTLDLSLYDQITIEVFAKFTTGNGLQMLYSQNNPNNVQGAFYVDTGEAGPASQKFSQRTASGFLVNTSPEPTDGGWHHYALTMDESGTNSVIKLFVDGYELDGGGATGDIQAFLNDYFTIGTYAPNTLFFYNGLMGEMRISSGVLSPSQFLIGASIPRIFITQQPRNTSALTNAPATFNVLAITSGGDVSPTLQYQWQRGGVDIPGATNSSYTLPNVTLADNLAQFDVVVSGDPATPVTSDSATLTVLTNNTLAFWKFDAGDPTADSSGNGNTLAFTGNITTSSDVPPNAPQATDSAVFDGGSYAQTVNTMDFTPFDQLTIEFFAKYPSGSPLQMFYSVNNVNNAQGAFYFDTGEAGPTALKVAQRTSGLNFETQVGPEPTDGGWHHYAVTMDEAGAAPDFRIYVDGAQVQVGGQPGGLQGFINDYWTIGAFPPGYIFPYVGQIAEMRVSAGILATDQFLTGPARLSIRLAGGQAVISWPQNAGSFTLQQSGSLPGTWTDCPITPVSSGDTWQVTAPAAGPATFYRLIR